MGEQLNASLCYRAQGVEEQATSREATVGLQGAGRAALGLGLRRQGDIKRPLAKRHFRQEPSLSEENKKEIKRMGVNMIGALLM